MKDYLFIPLLFIILFNAGSYQQNSSGFTSFAEYEWITKESVNLIGPGPNLFSRNTVDLFENGRMISLTISEIDGRWNSSEIYSDALFSYGEFAISFSLPERIDSNAVFGFFLYNDQEAPYFNEVDFEISAWGNPQNKTANFTVQPYMEKTNSLIFPIPDELVEYTIKIKWQKEEISYRLLDRYDNEVKSWKYTGDYIPGNTRSRVHMNLWLFKGNKPMGDGGLEVLIHDFSYKPIPK